MKNRISFLIILFLGSFSAIHAQNSEIIPGQYIVTLKESAAKPVVNSATSREEGQLQAAGAKSPDAQNLSKVKSVYDKGGVAKAKIIQEFGGSSVGFSAKLSNEEVEKIKKNPDVAGVYPDYKVSTAGSFTAAAEGEIPTISATQTIPCAVSTAGGPRDGSTKSTWIWVLATGIDLTHPDLNVQTNPLFAKSFIAGETINDGNGFGTFAAGLAAAKNNGFGIVGVSAGAKVVPVKVLNNSGSGSYAGIIAGLNHVSMYCIPGDVVILPVGGGGFNDCENSNPALRDAIRNLGNKGVWVTLATGSGSTNANTFIPGCINGTRILTVGTITCQYTYSSFGNYGRPPIDFVGVGVLTYSTYKGGGYTTWSSGSAGPAVAAGICHQRPSTGPVSGGTVIHNGVSYPIAKY